MSAGLGVLVLVVKTTKPHLKASLWHALEVQ